MNILFGVMGTSPAVLTETVWALVRADVPFIPDKIIVLTTELGALKIQNMLFSSGVWNAMLADLDKKTPGISKTIRFGAAHDHIRLLPEPDGRSNARDINSAESSAAAADFILRSLREFTEDPSTTIVASAAGGRKTMSVLLASCMMLLGRKQDRLCHVLVQPPFDSPNLQPLFFYPIRGQKHTDTNGKQHPASRARIELVDIPFVRVRGWYADKFSRVPPDYMTLVNRMQGIAPEATNYPIVRIDLEKATVRIGINPISLGSSEFALFALLSQAHIKKIPLKSWEAIGRQMEALSKSSRNVPLDIAWRHDLVDIGIDADDDPRKIASRLRKKIRASGLPDECIRALIPSPRDKGAYIYPAGKIRISGNIELLTSHDVIDTAQNT